MNIAGKRLKFRSRHESFPPIEPRRNDLQKLIAILEGEGQPLTGKGKVRPNAPAIATIVMITLISILAFAAIFSFVAGTKPRRSKGSDDFRAPADDRSR